MENNILEKLKAFIEATRWKYSFPLNEETRIEKDLKITGDDAIEFIIAFGKEFNVDISNFKADLYFSPEGDVILPAIIRFVTGKKKIKQFELTIEDLVNAVVAGRLDEAVLKGK